MGTAKAKIAVIPVESVSIVLLKVLPELDADGLRNSRLTHPHLLVVIREEVACWAPFHK